MNETFQDPLQDLSGLVHKRIMDAVSDSIAQDPDTELLAETGQDAFIVADETKRALLVAIEADLKTGSEQEHTCHSEISVAIGMQDISSLDKDHLFQVLERLCEITSRAVYENATEIERNIWTRHVVHRKRFTEIAMELDLTGSTVRRIWYRVMSRIADETRLLAAEDQALMGALGRTLTDPQAFCAILSNMMVRNDAARS